MYGESDTSVLLLLKDSDWIMPRCHTKSLCRVVVTSLLFLSANRWLEIPGIGNLTVMLWVVSGYLHKAKKTICPANWNHVVLGSNESLSLCTLSVVPHAYATAITIWNYIDCIDTFGFRWICTFVFSWLGPLAFRLSTRSPRGRFLGQNTDACHHWWLRQE